MQHPEADPRWPVLHKVVKHTTRRLVSRKHDLEMVILRRSHLGVPASAVCHGCHRAPWRGRRRVAIVLRAVTPVDHHRRPCV